MRYVQGGGLTDAGRAVRERERLRSVERFEGGDKNREIAAALRVSERSVERWRRQWRERGEAGALSKVRPGALGSEMLRSPGRSASWSAVRSFMGGPISGGHWPGSRR
ncbi:helix-turn-helix domain-containing protein [Streptomyces sp. NBC_00576]|nr:helix-turn-helix domain-containing protein [Streptomyces sp. NBC_00576]WUB73522.1 helix-turn-helix domain-containing protein [Streptomyces sp. NBC_00576]